MVRVVTNKGAEMADAVTETTETTTTETVVEESGDNIEAMRDALKKANNEAKKLRLEQKATVKALDEIRAATATEQEKLMMAARAEGRTEALREAGAGRVEDAVRAAAGGRNVDVDALLDGLDRTRFLDDNGNPDRDAIQSWIDRVAPAAQEPNDGFQMPDLGQGTRTPTPALGSDPLLNSVKSKLDIR